MIPKELYKFAKEHKCENYELVISKEKENTFVGLGSFELSDLEIDGQNRKIYFT